MADQAPAIPMPQQFLDPKFGEHKMAQLNDIKMHYVEKGDPKNPLMLFVHGFPENWYSWRYQVEEFHNDFRTVCVMMRGYGNSDKPEGAAAYAVNVLAEDLRQLVSHLKEHQITIVGHDWGGFVVCHFAQQYPDLIKRVIILNAAPMKLYKDLWTSSFRQFKASTYVIFLFNMPSLPESMIRKNNYEFLDTLFVTGPSRLQQHQLTEEEVQLYKSYISLPGALTAGMNYYRALNRHAPPKSEGAKKIKRPLLLLFGKNDPFLTMDIPRDYPKYADDLTIKYLDCSHWVQQEKYEEVNEYIREFIKNTP